MRTPPQGASMLGRKVSHEVGGLGYITKPFDPSELIDRVREVLERAGRGEREAVRREWQERLETG